MAMTPTTQPPPVVVHIPHASIVVPTDAAPPILLTPRDLERELLVMTDRYTDELFGLPSGVATCIIFPVSRLIVDAERFTDDAQEKMAKKGMGVVYTQTSDGRALRPTPTPAERQVLLARFYEPHHAALTQAVDAVLTTRDSCLVIDGHSFTPRRLPFEYDENSDRPDICIGTDETHTPGWLRDVAVRAFEHEGWRVAVDRPFKGALVPARYYAQKDTRVRAVMVELNRALYMDESGARLATFSDVLRRVRNALGKVVDENARRSGR